MPLSWKFLWEFPLGVCQRPLTLMLLQKHRDTNRSRIVIQIGGVYTTVCEKEGILLQKYRDRNGRCTAILFKSIGVRGRLYMGEMGSICHFARALPASLWGHCSQVLVFASIWGAHKKGCDSDTFRAVFPSIWVCWDPPSTAKQGKTQMTNRPCFTLPQGSIWLFWFPLGIDW